MKVYCYGSPSRGLLRVFLAARNRAIWLRWPLALLLVLVWVALMPPAWIAIHLGEAGHRVAEWCGFDSRDW